MGDFSLERKLGMVVDLGNNISFGWSFPKAFSPRLGGGDHEPAGDVGLSADLLVLQHQTNVHLCVLSHLYSELRVVEPPIVALRLTVIPHLLKRLLCLVPYCFLKTSGAPPSVSLGRPLRLYRINFPTLGEDLINDYLLKLDYKISEAHPP